MNVVKKKIWCYCLFFWLYMLKYTRNDDLEKEFVYFD